MTSMWLLLIPKCLPPSLPPLVSHRTRAHTHGRPAGKTHQIDGIILTKFDTVDEKVGAALSMCYKTGQPILFVGTGQKYTHLKKLQPAMILNCLFR